MDLDANDAPSPSKLTRSLSSLRRIVGQEDGISNTDDTGDGMDMDEDILTLDSDITPRRVSRPFKEVAIPIKSAHELQAPTQRRSRVPALSPSSVSSLGTVNGYNSSEYETPGTSAVVTPAELSTKKSSVLGDPTMNSTVVRGTSKISASARAQQLRTSTFSLSIVKPGLKRESIEPATVVTEMSADAQLARALQQEEYDARPSKRTKFEVEDSLNEDRDDDSSVLSLRSTPASEISAPLLGTNRRRTEKSACGMKLPRRAARDIARKSIAEKAMLMVVDSEDTDLTDFESDDFQSVGSESDALEEVSDDENPASNPLASVDATIASSTSRSRSSRGRPSQAAIRRAAAQSNLRGRAQRERAKLEKQHPQVKTMWDTLDKVPKIAPMQAEQPDAITRQLKSFQLEGLNWMIKQEKSQWKGGLLGDEMGMGKTIQAVSLIMSDYPAKDPTLVVVPPVALMQWSSEIQEYTNGKLKVLIYHNSNPKVKTMKQKDLRQYNIIMISYSGLESMYRKETKGWKRNVDDERVLVKSDSVIHGLHFHRLILDEAHNIKTRTTATAKACFSLKADFKWCLSGTPVQNRIGEFFSLLRFLEVKPFACYLCKVCQCAELHWSQDASKRCTHCMHRGFDHVSIFNQEILNPITQAEDDSLRRQALDKLRLITDRIMLRRVKKDHTASMELPPKEVIIHNEFFGEIERDFSSSIMSNTVRQFDTYVSRGVMLNNYANIFGLIMQMRQVANHPDLILKKHAEGGQNVLVCVICDEPAEEAIRSRCHHEFCRRCAKDYVQSFEGSVGIGGDADCPRCHIPLSIDFDQPDIEQDEEVVKKNSIINRIKMEDWTSSTKIEMLVYDLYKLRSKKQTHKSIVFSQFTSMLQLVEWRLRRAGFKTVMLDGSMSPAQRQNSIEYFMKNTDVEVFLVSLKAGGVALNLTEASRVFIIDPWWNPAAEWQSADRCHRIGQKRPCVITRLCIEDSVESRMVMLQEKKANMINGTINNDKVAMEKLTPEDMQFLFRGA
ncbi:MAG: DNA repair protein rad16 [Pycnora praestabilis]|nr:MAG: DNA repair protein rad16 [Pycnora praestabilis]